LLPWVILIVGIGFWLVEPVLEEQALLEARPAQVLLRVTIPAAWTAIGVATVWVVVTTVGEMTVTDLFMVRTFAEELYTRRAGMGETPSEAFRGMTAPLLVLVWLIFLGLALCEKLVPSTRPLGIARRPVFRLQWLRWPVGVVVATGVAGFVGVPLGNLCYKAGVVVSQTDTGLQRSWSAIRCLATVAASPLHHAREFGWTATIGVAAATTAVLAAIPLAWAACRGGSWARVILVFLALFLVVPGPVIGLAVIWLVNRPEIPPLAWMYGHSILAPWLALSIRSLPLATLVIWFSFRMVSREIVDAAALDGAGPLARLCRIVVPMRLEALALAWLVAFTMTLGDLAASILVMPPGLTTLSVRIFGLLHYGVEDRVAGICLTLVTLMAALVGLAAWLARKTGRIGNPSCEQVTRGASDL
jgi:iron(III) transport system permease protein